MAKKSRKTIDGLSDLFDHFAQNARPITFIGATPYGCLGLDSWVSGFEYISALDCVSGLRRGVVAPVSDRQAVFYSAAETCNELLRHSEVRAHLNNRGPGLLWPTDADEETYFLAKELGQTIMLAKPDIRRKFSRDVDTRLTLSKSGVTFVPQVVTTVSNYQELVAEAQKAKLGSHLVAQLDTLKNERQTHFITSETDWNHAAELVAGREATISRYISHNSFYVESVAAGAGTLCGPVLQLHSMSTVSGAVADTAATNDVKAVIHRNAQKVGSVMADYGFVGVFGCRFYVETGTNKVFLRSITPKTSEYSQFTHHLTSTYGGLPLHLFHLVEHMDINGQFDFVALQKRWAEYACWTQLVMHHGDSGTDFITKGPPSSIYLHHPDGQAELVADSIDPRELRSSQEFLFMRTLGTGVYREKGLETGLILNLGNTFENITAESLNNALVAQFSTVQMSGTSLPSRPSSIGPSLF
jgi:hypothetical protein